MGCCEPEGCCKQILDGRNCLNRIRMTGEHDFDIAYRGFQTGQHTANFGSMGAWSDEQEVDSDLVVALNRLLREINKPKNVE